MKRDQPAVHNSMSLCLSREQTGVCANSREFLFIPTTVLQPSADINFSSLLNNQQIPCWVN